MTKNHPTATVVNHLEGFVQAMGLCAAPTNADETEVAAATILKNWVDHPDILTNVVSQRMQGIANRVHWMKKEDGSDMTLAKVLVDQIEEQAPNKLRRNEIFGILLEQLRGHFPTPTSLT